MPYNYFWSLNQQNSIKWTLDVSVYFFWDFKNNSHHRVQSYVKYLLLLYFSPLTVLLNSHFSWWQHSWSLHSFTHFLTEDSVNPCPPSFKVYLIIYRSGRKMTACLDFLIPYCETLKTLASSFTSIGRSFTVRALSQKSTFKVTVAVFLCLPFCASTFNELMFALTLPWISGNNLFLM